ncbi:coiled-coil domain-containing protein 171 isoform X3 [Octopus sinensis]|uniref:Coiled-coil domain-containing protein 171 isoform X3 n=1 Tax=Octopus sinensis TaxID=2607531 RepID=A0A7E6EIK1_9MOLL|nr:coiled-coil domain-containing protein 171 isoform X3 [Octopus sinensis]
MASTNCEKQAKICSVNYIPEPIEKTFPHNKTFPDMADLSDSFLGESNSEVFPDWNKYQIQVKELQLDLASERENALQSRRKWNNLVTEKLELTTKMNYELTTKASEIAKLQSELEKSEAERQNLEYELLKVIQDQKLASDHAAKLNTKLETENSKLKDEVRTLAGRLNTLQNELDDSEQKVKTLSANYESVIKEKEQELSQLNSQKSTLESEYQQEKTMFEKQQVSLTEMVKKYEGEKSKLEDDLKKSLMELKESQEKELNLKRDLNTAFSHIKSMEISIESERETHLESKFKTEVMQMHVQDLDKTLQMERTASKEAQKTFEEMNKKLSKLQTTYEEEKALNCKYKTDLTGLREELSLIQSKMTTELNNKNSVIHTMSKETEIHLKNFHKLKDELSKAKKRQIYLEEKHTGCMRELDILLHNFLIEDKSKLAKNTVSKPGKHDLLPGKSLKSGVLTTSSATEQLRQILTTYKHKVDKAAEENIKQKSLVNSLSKEIATFKELLITKDRTIEDSQTNYTQCAKELCRLRSKFKQLEEETLQLKIEVESGVSLKKNDKVRIEELTKEIMNLKVKHKKEMEENLAYLHSVYQRLLADRPLPYPKERIIADFSWFDLTLLINEQVSSVLNSIQKANQKVSHLEDSLRQKESCITGLQKSYEEQLSHMMTLSKERELTWQKQKTEIQSQYENELRVINNQIKDKQAIAEKAIDKMKCSSHIHKELESKCKKVQELLYTRTTHNAQLQIVCCLLCGLLTPLYTQILDLIMQCYILKESIKRSETTFSHLRLLIQSFSCQLLKFEEDSKDKPHNKFSYKKSPILRLRCYVIVILAANRLIFLSRTNKPLLSAFDIALGPVSLRVQANIDQNFLDSFSDCLSKNSDEGKSKGLLQLLSSQNLNESLRMSVTELQKFVSNATKNDVSQLDTKSFLVCARGTLNQIANILVRNFQNTNYMIPSSGLTSRDSLISRLACGLQTQLRIRPQATTNTLLYQKDMIQSLQNYTSDLNRHVHKMTTQLQQLKQKQDISAQEKEQFELDKSTIFHLQEQLKQLHERQQKQISVETFEKLVFELKSSMLREQRNDQLLREQSAQLTEISSQLEEQNNKVFLKENILSEVTETLSKCQDTLKTKEQSLYEVKNRIKQNNSEKAELQENLLDAERTLRTAAQDKMVLQKYLKSVHKQFDKVKEQISFSKTCDPCSSLPLLLKAEHIPSVIGKTAPELIACQNLVKSFVDCQLQAFRRVAILEEEVSSMRKHLNTLKVEFSNVIHQKRDEMRPRTHSPRKT